MRQLTLASKPAGEERRNHFSPLLADRHYCCWPSTILFWIPPEDPSSNPPPRTYLGTSKQWTLLLSCYLRWLFIFQLLESGRGGEMAKLEDFWQFVLQVDCSCGRTGWSVDEVDELPPTNCILSSSSATLLLIAIRPIIAFHNVTYILHWMSYSCSCITLTHGQQHPVVLKFCDLGTEQLVLNWLSCWQLFWFVGFHLVNSASNWLSSIMSQCSTFLTAKPTSMILKHLGKENVWEENIFPQILNFGDCFNR